MLIPALVLTAYDLFIRKNRIHTDVGWTYMVSSRGEPYPCHYDRFDYTGLMQSKS